MGKGRERQIILKTDKRTVLLELGLGGKFQAKSAVLEVEVCNGRCVLTHVPAEPRSAGPRRPALFSERGVTV
jgi:hypothetical protein